MTVYLVIFLQKYRLYTVYIGFWPTLHIWEHLAIHRYTHAYKHDMHASMLFNVRVHLLCLCRHRQACVQMLGVELLTCGPRVKSMK